jgi:hypothetical protein
MRNNSALLGKSLHMRSFLPEKRKRNEEREIPARNQRLNTLQIKRVGAHVGVPHVPKAGVKRSTYVIPQSAGVRPQNVAALNRKSKINAGAKFNEFEHLH